MVFKSSTSVHLSFCRARFYVHIILSVFLRFANQLVKNEITLKVSRYLRWNIIRLNIKITSWREQLHEDFFSTFDICHVHLKGETPKVLLKMISLPLTLRCQNVHLTNSVFFGMPFKVQSQLCFLFILTVDYCSGFAELAGKSQHCFWQKLNGAVNFLTATQLADSIKTNIIPACHCFCARCVR